MFILVCSLHILAAIWFTCGIAGYAIARLAAVKTENLGSLDALVGMMTRFKNLMIRPGGILLVIFGVWTAWYESWPRFTLSAIALLVIFVPFMVLTVRGLHELEAVRTEAIQAGSVTPALRAALRDRRSMIGDIGISIITVLFLLLMLLKPA